MSSTSVRRGAAWSLAVLALITVFFGVFLLRTSGGTQPASSNPFPSGPVGPIISDGRPAFASAGVARYGNDRDYGTAWTVAGSGWLAYDLSSVPVERRTSVLLAWYASPDDQAGLGSSCRTPDNEPVRPFLRDYVVEGHRAGPGSPPEAGWLEMAKVSGGSAFSGQHLLDMTGLNWIRIRGGGPNGVGINLDIATVQGGNPDSWLFLGDSITGDFAGHGPLTAPDGSTVRSFTDLIEAGTHRSRRPIAQNAGLDCDLGTQLPPRIDTLLAAFPGRFVTLAYGTNDAMASMTWGLPTPEDFYDAMAELVARVRAAGKVPVVPTIPWPNAEPARIRQVREFNSAIKRLYRDDPALLRGPDLYRLLAHRERLFRDGTNLHPNQAGQAAIRTAWADWALENVYLTESSAGTKRPAPRTGPQHETRPPAG